jgi:hypothetical protein
MQSGAEARDFCSRKMDAADLLDQSTDLRLSAA